MKGRPTYYRFQFIVGMVGAFAIALDQLTMGIRLMIGTINVPIVSTTLVVLAGGMAYHAWIKLQQKRRCAAME